MAITAAPYMGFLLGLPQGQFNLNGNNTYVALADGSYVPDLESNRTLSHVTGRVTDATPQRLTGVDFTYSMTTYTVTVVAADVVWPAASFTAHYAVLYLKGSTDNVSPLIGYINFGSDRVYDSEDFTLTFTNGFVQIPAA
jgi:hypothetical protein